MWMLILLLRHGMYTSGNSMCCDIYEKRTGIGQKGSTTDAGFRPIVCLSSKVKLIDNGDGTYRVQ